MEKQDNRPFDLTVNFPYDGSVICENGSICCKVKYDDGSGDEIFGVEGVSSAFITYDDTLVINLSDGNRRMKNVAELMDFITNDIEFGDYAHNIRTYGRAYEEMSWHQCAALFLLSPNTNGEEKYYAEANEPNQPEKQQTIEVNQLQMKTLDKVLTENKLYGCGFNYNEGEDCYKWMGRNCRDRHYLAICRSNRKEDR